MNRFLRFYITNAAAAALVLGTAPAGELTAPHPQLRAVSVVRVEDNLDAKAAPAGATCGGYPVIAGTARRLNAAQSETLTAVLRDPASFSAGKTRCGFRPGMAVRLEGGATAADALVCFGCSEIQFFSEERFGEKQVMSSPLRAALLAVAHAVWPEDEMIRAITE